MKREHFCDLCTSCITRYLHHVSHTEAFNLVWILVFWNVQHCRLLQKSPSHSVASCCPHLQTISAVRQEWTSNPAQFGSFIKPVLHNLDSSVGIVTRYVLNSPRIDSRRGRQDFPQTPRPGLGPTQPPVLWVPGLFPEGKADVAWHWPPTLI
jgi:hypothetical protein